MLRPLLLGEAPSATGAHLWRTPLAGHPARTLCKILGMSLADGADWHTRLTVRFDTMNVVERYEDSHPWTRDVQARARARWVRYLLDLFDDPVLRDEHLFVVALGRKAAEIIGAPDEWGAWREMPGGKLAATSIPHPSGLNRLYNSTTTQALARRVLREAETLARACES